MNVNFQTEPTRSKSSLTQDRVQNKPGFTVREPSQSEAEMIAQLFQIVYRESSHPCKDPAYVRATMHSGNDFWLVAVANGKVVACTAMQRQVWNGVFEACRSVTHPEYRCHGLGGLLYRKSLEQVSRRPDFTFAFGFPRTRGMLRLLCADDVELPFIILGHDGAMNVANGRREYHLVGMTGNREALRHIVPADSEFTCSPFFRERVLGPLRMIDEVGQYPEAYVVGPPDGEHAVVEGVMFRYRYMPELPSRAFELLEINAPDKTAQEIGRALSGLLARFPDVAHVSANVLLDKRDLIVEMQNIGFELSAYIPAFYLHDERRYDCLMLTRGSFTEEPVNHETMDLIESFRQNLADLFMPELAAAA